MSVLVVVAIWSSVGRRPPWTVQPAMAAATTGRGRRRLRPAHPPWWSSTIWAATTLDDEDDRSIVMDSLRALGLVRKRVERPVVGRRAYVRLWERIRAIVVLTAIIVTLGAVVAAAIGLIVLAAGFLLEQAIS